MITRVTVENHGVFTIDSENINELLMWLNSHKTSVRMVTGDTPKLEGANNDDRMLITEG